MNRITSHLAPEAGSPQAQASLPKPHAALALIALTASWPHSVGLLHLRKPRHRKGRPNQKHPANPGASLKWLQIAKTSTKTTRLELRADASNLFPSSVTRREIGPLSWWFRGETSLISQDLNTSGSVSARSKTDGSSPSCHISGSTTLHWSGHIRDDAVRDAGRRFEPFLAICGRG